VKLFLTANHLETKAARLQHKLKAVEHIIDSYEDIEKQALLKKLAQSLLFPDSYFISLHAPQLASLLSAMLAFLQNKSHPFSISNLSLENINQPYILVNCQNVPFVIDSLISLQNKGNIAFQLIAHPVLTIKRRGGKILELNDQGLPGTKELFIVIRVHEIGQDNIADSVTTIQQTIKAVLQANDGRSLIMEKLNRLKMREGFCQWKGFLEWLEGGAFKAFRYQQFLFESTEKDSFNPSSSFIGLAFDDIQQAAFSEEIHRVLNRETDILVASFSFASPIDCTKPLVYIGFRESRRDGGWLEHAFFGLFDEFELSGAACKVPVLYQKVKQVLALIGITENSYEYCRLIEIFNFFPKVELFMLTETQLSLLGSSLNQYLYRPETVKLLVLASPNPCWVSAFIIVPKQLYLEGVEYKLFDCLCDELKSQLASQKIITLGDRFVGLQLALIPEHDQLVIDVNSMDRLLNKLVRPWSVSLNRIIQRAFDNEQANRLWEKYRNSFSADYQESMPPRYAIKDILQIEQIEENSTDRVCLISPCQKIQQYRLNFYSLQEKFLDEYIPVLENLSLRLIDQVQFPVLVDNSVVYIKSFTIKAATTQAGSFNKLKPDMLDAIQAIVEGKAENDPLNRLLVLTGMTWKQIDVLRAYRNYFLQLGYQSRISSFHRSLINNPQVTKCLFAYFEARFRPNPEWDDPMIREEQILFPLRMQLLTGIESVTDINDDRIFRTLFNLIDATVRSNYHVRENREDYFIAFKINSLGIIEMPAPKPQNEIYVHSINMEGIHLRGGKIARGGIRWSDRPDDFRTEILGLMQTQMSKNALIIPKGAKGGFVVKQNGGKKSWQEAGQQAYIKLIQGILDLTDNYIEDKVVQLPGIVSYDDNDPYLVVAADKGTAQFPDLANSVAAEYKFWLADAFASGSSTGYNHKSLGITARGAWECVKRHFRELGKDIQTQPFTVVGIGSMDGDVFGNGMLLSPCIRLLAAFSGEHIFIDPNPEDLQASFNERKRLFETAGSSWDDYQRELISEGGGVFRRDAKNIPVSTAIKKWLGIHHQTQDGESLIRSILTAKVELLWLGGIGTYVKASNEKQDEVGDRSNDSVRVDAAEICAQVIGEGANLGFTQKARTEYCISGGKINTDAIDNSAGVDISDHEVNLKILLSELQKKNIIANSKPIFFGLTEDICQSVLTNNYAQSLSLSLDQRRCLNRLESFLHLAERLTSAGYLDTEVSSFPNAKTVLSRPGRSLSRPELAVLMAATKMYLTQQLLGYTSLLNASYCECYLQAYFPEQIRVDFKDHLKLHPLANEIKATYISNQIINQAGSGFLNIMLEAENGSLLECVESYLTFDRVLGGEQLRREIYRLDNKISTTRQYELLLQLENTLAVFCQWALLHKKRIQPTDETLEDISRYLQANEHYFMQEVKDPLEGKYKGQLDHYLDEGIPNDIAQRILFVSGLDDFPYMMTLSKDTKQPFDKIIGLFDQAMRFLGLNAIYEILAEIQPQDQWEGKILIDVKTDMKTVVGSLIKQILQTDCDACADYFSDAARKQKLTHYQRVYRESSNAQPVRLLPVLALSKELEKLLD
jgi:glutamate dehydrogenase